MLFFLYTWIYIFYLSTVVDKELKTGNTDRENHLNINEKDVFCTTQTKREITVGNN